MSEQSSPKGQGTRVTVTIHVMLLYIQIQIQHTLIHTGDTLTGISIFGSLQGRDEADSITGEAKPCTEFCVSPSFYK